MSSPPARAPAAVSPAVLAVVALGGVVGAEARYGVALALPHRAGDWPWSSVLTNLAGCLLIGVLMVVVLELIAPHPLTRPFLGVGVLGGFTTFSTFALDADALVRAHRPLLAVAYLAVTLFGGLLAVAAGMAAARRVGRQWRRP